MDFYQVSDDLVLLKTVRIVREERELLTSLLHHLREIEKRRLYSARGYKSLFDFSVRYLGYSEDAAYRRISAMRLLKEIPEIEQKINQGEISLSHIGLAHSFFRQEEKHADKTYSRAEKLQVFEQISSKPLREAEKITASLSSLPEEMKPDQVKLISETLMDFKFQGRVELQNKITTLKGLLANKNPNLSLGELFEMLCDLGLEQWDPSKNRDTKKRCVKNTPAEKSEDQWGLSSAQKKISQAQIRRDVFLNAKNQCEKCKSTFALEIDHRKPRALGGSSDPSNLRVLCRSCNQRAAIETFGLQKMRPFIEPLFS